MHDIHRRTLLKSTAAARPRRRAGLLRAAFRGGEEGQARGQRGAHRGRRAELLHRRRHAAGEGRRRGRARHQQAGRRLREHRRHAGLAHAGPCVLREHPCRQEALRDHQAQLRHAGAVARPLRAGHRRRGAAQGPEAADRAAHHPQGLPQGHGQLFRFRGGRPQDRRPAWAATSSSAASRPCSSPASRPISASPGPRWMRARPASRST